MFPMRHLVLLLLLGSLMGADAGKAKPEVIKKFRLELHAPDQGGLYFTAWADGDVIAAKDASDGKTVQYFRRYYWADRCEWVATETLQPIDAKTYAYTYRETPVKCAGGAKPSLGAVTPRDGKVTVHPLDKDRPLTPLDAWSRGYDRP